MKGMRTMKFKCLKTRDERKLEDRDLKYTYYYNDVKNEWYYEDEIVTIDESKIIIK